MDEYEYKPNSHKYKEAQKSDQPKEEERKKVEKIANGRVKTKKKNEIAKFKDVFIAEDVSNVKSYILMEVLVPAIKKAVSDIVTNGIDMILYGGNGRGGKERFGASKISYQRYYDRRDDRPSFNESRTRSGYSYDDIILDSRGEAEEVLARLDELIATYGMVSVADLYDLVGVTGNYTDNKYGWVNIRNAEPIRLRDGGYMLKLPKALPLDI